MSRKQLLHEGMSCWTWGLTDRNQSRSSHDIQSKNVYYCLQCICMLKLIEKLLQNIQAAPWLLYLHASQTIFWD